MTDLDRRGYAGMVVGGMWAAYLDLAAPGWGWVVPAGVFAIAVFMEATGSENGRK